MSKTTFYCRGCSEALADVHDVDIGDVLSCDGCGRDYEVYDNGHPSFGASVKKVTE